MSVENEILRIQHNIANTYAAVSRKGGEVPLQPTSANLPAAVESIPQGPTYTAGDGIDITETEAGASIGVTTPVQGIVTQAEFNAMPEAERNRGLYVISDGGGGGSSAGEVYSTEEIRIGTWIDGKPLYQMTKTGTISSNSLNAYAPPIGFVFSEKIDTPVYLEPVIYNGTITIFGEQGSIESIVWNHSNNRIEVYLTANTYIGSAITCTIRYTKTTDEGGTA